MYDAIRSVIFDGNEVPFCAGTGVGIGVGVGVGVGVGIAIPWHAMTMTTRGQGRSPFGDYCCRHMHVLSLLSDGVC